MKFLIALLIFSTYVEAREERYLGRSARGLLMGDAYTALADDEYTLFYNPAVLGRHKGFSFWAINPSLSVTNPLKEDLDDFSNLGSDPADISSAIMGKPIHIGLGANPGFKMGRFGLNAIVNYNSNFTLLNEVTPMLDVDHRYDRGFIMGYGFPLSTDGLSVGFAAKYLKRESIFGTYNLTSPTVIDAFGSGDPEDIMNALGQVTGRGWGFDFGLDYVKTSGAKTVSVGLSMLDLYTNLTTEDNPDNREVQPQPMQVNLGTALSVEVGPGLDFTLSGDIRNLEQQMELMRRVRLGIEIGLTPAFAILGGLNANQYSYGFKLNTGLLKIYCGFYSADIGEKLGQQKSERVALYLSLFDFTFDG
ncbi:MAG: hypothetical protein KC478_09515 [Bacteriovoracaceae bacterium]|nr:hypothetical protein [Bacteriovoracaceae bacterium]